ncbi:MAG: caspase family protein [Deltaproteobacteria bacterium]|nr:caspase family protein [Deltaproteobacteria bacterium]
MVRRASRLLLILPLFVACDCSEDDDDKANRPHDVQAPTAVLLETQAALQPRGDGSMGSDHDVGVTAGQHITIQLLSSQFDPVLQATPPGSGTLTNDDFQGNHQESRLSFVVAESGTLKVVVSSHQTGATGNYSLKVVASGAPGGVAPATGQSMLQAGASVDGEVGADDPALPDGRHQETILLAGGDAGPLELMVEARSAVVPLAVLMSPNGHAINPSESGRYAIAHPGVHRLQLLTPTPAAVAPYHLTLSTAGTPSAPTLARNHHQLPTAAATTPATVGQAISGTLAAGDATLPSGERADLYALTGTANQPVHFELSSSAFDAYLMVVGPSGRHWENDDAGGTTNSVLDMVLPAAGTYRIVASSFRADETGAYDLKISGGARTPGMPHVAAATPSTPTPSGGSATVRQGSLQTGDETLESGEFVDRYNFDWPAGSSIDVSLTSTAFDPYVIVIGPDGQQEDNDDISASDRNAGLTYAVRQAGTHRVLVTSYESGESGAYRLSVTPSGAAAQPSTPAVAANANQRVISGSLASGDSTLQSGELFDEHTMTFTRGQHVHLEARSSEFDTYLIVHPPSGNQQDNDDGTNGTNAELDFIASTAGSYRVVVTSYEPGEHGNYQLVVGGAAGGGGGAAPAPTPTPGPAVAATGDSVAGSLASGDGQLDSGEFVDVYTRTFTPGSPVEIRLTSSAIDPYLIVTSPSGHQLDNDDLDPSTRNAGVDLPAAESGTYRISVTSYRPGETGAYSLSFGAGQPVPSPGGAGGHVYGLFVGISDYPAGVGDLPECANDAIKLAEALRTHGLLDAQHQVVLTDAQATRGNVRNALQRLSGQMGPDDVFIFFYSGHGGQQQRGASSDAREIDRTDEYLVLYDGELLDDELGRLFQPVRAGIAVAAIDACFSGGFAKDLITQPGRVGLFSSEEDVLSAVASQFQAGGYLSHFMRTAVSGQADASPRDQVLTVGELTHFLYTQFGTHATDVELQGAYQHLVIDRGAVRVDQVLWSYQ